MNRFLQILEHPVSILAMTAAMLLTAYAAMSFVAENTKPRFIQTFTIHSREELEKPMQIQAPNDRVRDMWFVMRPDGYFWEERLECTFTFLSRVDGIQREGPKMVPKDRISAALPTVNGQREASLGFTVPYPEAPLDWWNQSYIFHCEFRVRPGDPDSPPSFPVYIDVFYRR